MKTCSKCKQDKELTEFSKNIKSNDGLQGPCKACHTEYLKQHYLDNKVYYKKKAKKSRGPRRLVVLQWVVDYLKEHPCVDCGESNPIVLEFDHLRDKYKSVSNLISSLASIDFIKKEIEKCEVRCCNCHRKKTAEQFGWYKGIAL